MIEKFWDNTGPILLTNDGDSFGRIEVLSAINFHVKQQVILQSNTTEGFFEIKRIIGPNIIELGPRKTPLSERSDVSAFLTADVATIRGDKQPRNEIPEKEYKRAVYAEEPVVAWRTVLVNPFGNYYTVDNPLPVQLSDGSINIDTLNANLQVQLTHLDNFPNPGDIADSVQIGDGSNILNINPDGSINVSVGAVNTPKIENIDLLLANTEYSYTFTQDTKKFKLRIRDGKAKLKIAYNVGESGTDFWTVERGAYLEEGGLDLSGGVTIYFQATHPNTVLELQYWESI
ncbi:MAG: hypothetical protein MOGMAGMI_00303 [Candidatus Omnitrophica bacterium]|nr:hypothetical protein [Candidatus Omnitrophota bacterium]